jgi:hypothetical protein
MENKSLEDIWINFYNSKYCSILTKEDLFQEGFLRREILIL